jgi:hypothetical protein
LVVSLRFETTIDWAATSSRNRTKRSARLISGNKTKSAASRRLSLLRRVQIAQKPASKTLGLHGIFMRGKGLQHLIADSTFKRLQVDDPGAHWLDADKHHLGLALRAGGALDCNERNDRR